MKKTKAEGYGGWKLTKEQRAELETAYVKMCRELFEDINKILLNKRADCGSILEFKGTGISPGPLVDFLRQFKKPPEKK